MVNKTTVLYTCIVWRPKRKLIQIVLSLQIVRCNINLSLCTTVSEYFLCGFATSYEYMYYSEYAYVVSLCISSGNRN